MTANWTPPATWVTDELVTAAKLNEQIRDNLEYLKTPPVAVRNLSGARSTTSAAWVDIDPALTIALTTTGGDVLVGYTIRSITNSATGKGADVGLSVDGAAPGQYVTATIHPDSSDYQTATGVFLLTGLSAGTHTFRLQWAAFGGGTTLLSSAGRVHFFAREV